MFCHTNRGHTDSCSSESTPVWGFILSSPFLLAHLLLNFLPIFEVHRLTNPSHVTLRSKVQLVLYLYPALLMKKEWVLMDVYECVRSHSELYAECKSLRSSGVFVSLTATASVTEQGGNLFHAFLKIYLPSKRTQKACFILWSPKIIFCDRFLFVLTWWAGEPQTHGQVTPNADLMLSESQF